MSQIARVNGNIFDKFLPAMMGASVEAAELLIKAVDIFLARGPARGLGVDALLLGLLVDHGTLGGVLLG